MMSKDADCFVTRHLKSKKAASLLSNQMKKKYLLDLLILLRFFAVNIAKTS